MWRKAQHLIGYLLLVFAQLLCAQDRITLDQDWLFCPAPAFDPNWVPEPSECKNIDLPAAWEVVFPGYDGYGVFSRQFELPESLASDHLGLFISRIRDADKTYINGELVGAMGGFPPVFDKGVLYARMYSLPLRLLKQHNEIRIWVYNDGRTGGMPDQAPVIGLYENLITEYHDKNRKLVGMMAILFVFAIFHLIHFLFNRKDREHLYFSGFLLFWTVYLQIICESTAQSGLPLSWLFRANVVTFFCLYTIYPLFIHAFFQQPLPKFLKWIVTSIIVLIPVVMLLPYDHWVYYPLQYAEIMLLPMLYYLFKLLKYAWINQLPYARVMAMSNLAYALLGGHDVLIDFFGLRVNQEAIMFGPWALLILSAVLTLILAHRHKMYFFDATTDQMTSALRLPYFEIELDQLLAAARKQRLMVLAAMVDIDRFKQINDQFGHGMGNEVIKLVARAMRRNLHQTDLLTRYGGDEFCFAVVGANKDELIERVESIHRQISVLRVRNREEIKIGVTFGTVIQWVDRVMSADQLIKEADALLIKTKQENKGGIGASYD